jgi:hypothetical protein
MSEDAPIIGFMPTKVSSNIQKQMPTIIVGSLTLMASLAWNDSFKALIDQYVPDQYKNSKNAWFKVLYSFILTSVIIIVISIILAYSSDKE